MGLGLFFFMFRMQLARLSEKCMVRERLEAHAEQEQKTRSGFTSQRERSWTGGPDEQEEQDQEQAPLVPMIQLCIVSSPRKTGGGLGNMENA